MQKIGGNTDCVFKIRKYETTEIGEHVESWEPLLTQRGFLDFMSGNKDYINYNRAVEDSTHVFVCDYVSIDADKTDLMATINGVDYDITYIDDPMGLHYHLEVFLKRVGD